MATKSAKKPGEKRKVAEIPGEKTEKSKDRKDGPHSTRKLFKNSDASDDGSDNDLSDGEDGGAELPAKKKVKQARDSEKTQSKGSADQKPGRGGETSRESHIKQKQLAKERKASRPLAEELQRAKKIWERLRRKSHVPMEERHKLVEELFEIIEGRIKDFVLKHDAVRAVQTALKYAKPEQRKTITKELQGTYAQLAEGRYAKFLIGKMLVQDDPEIRDMVIPEFYGKVRKLINHPEAGWILDDIYRGVATKEQKAVLLREWYGPEFSLFRKEGDGPKTAELSVILEENPEKRGPIIKHLMGMIDQLVQKKMNGFTMLHDAMLQCFLNLKTGSEEQTEFLQKVKDDETGDLLKNMAFTKSGSRLACLILAHGSAKDRKQYLRLYKDTFEAMSGDQYGHRIILTAYDVIDDTVLTSKTILPEILGKKEEKHNIIFGANNLNARITLLYPFEGTSRALFPPGHQEGLELLKEVHEIRQSTSRKDPETRRKELVTAMSPALLEAIATSAKELVSTSFGCQFVTDVLLGAVGDKGPALQAVAEVAAGVPSAPEGSEELYLSQTPHPSQTDFAGRMYKILIQGGRFDRKTKSIKTVEPPLDFANILYPVIKDHIVAWSTGRSSFVIVALLESESFSQKEKIRKVLNKHKAELEKAATTPVIESDEGTDAIKQEAVKEEAGKQVKQRSGKQERGRQGKKPPIIGNPGSRILLERL